MSDINAAIRSARRPAADNVVRLPQIHSLRVADEIVRELAGRGYEIRRVET